MVIARAEAFSWIFLLLILLLHYRGKKNTAASSMKT